ncbi:MAG: PHP domain-containing protein, partial [Dehalococcoidia bacterium]
MAGPQSSVSSHTPHEESSGWQQPARPYVELHAHSCWSLREGASATDELVDRALRLRYPALALTDHDNLYGAMEFARAAHERGLKPITGCEITLAPDARISPPLHGRVERGPGGEVPTHLTLLAATVDGYRNICRLLTRAYKTYGKDTPMVEKAWLFEHHEGLIVLSGCPNSELSLLLEPGSDSRFTIHDSRFGQADLGQSRARQQAVSHDIEPTPKGTTNATPLSREVERGAGGEGALPLNTTSQTPPLPQSHQSPERQRRVGAERRGPGGEGNSVLSPQSSLLAELSLLLAEQQLPSPPGRGAGGEGALPLNTTSQTPPLPQSHQSPERQRRVGAERRGPGGEGNSVLSPQSSLLAELSLLLAEQQLPSPPGRGAGGEGALPLN